MLDTLTLNNFDLSSCFNGIDGETGSYLTPPLRARQIARIAEGARLSDEELAEVRGKRPRPDTYLGLHEGADPQDLTQAGWGIIFAPDIPDAVKCALKPLTKLREEEAGVVFTDFPGERAYRLGDDKSRFLGRSRMAPGQPANPKKVPYYLLIVGSPEVIPYSFQYQLAVQHAVGRLHFDTVEDYRTYALSVRRAEIEPCIRSRQATFFATRNPADRATQLSADHLVKPLREALSTAIHGWEFPNLPTEEATKAKLTALLGGRETPALLFTASHGMCFPRASERQYTDQGALLCQEWPGPLRHTGPIPPEFYLAAHDIGRQASVEGLIAYFFGCYGAGTPTFDDFPHLANQPRVKIAPEAFVASLPKRLLGHPGGGALAVVGHVERTWSYSFVWERTGEQIGAFESALTALLRGKRIGSAMEYFSIRYAELSSDLTLQIEERKDNDPRRLDATKRAEEERLAGLWTANNDARSFVILGDPAVRVPRSFIPARDSRQFSDHSDTSNNLPCG